MSHSPGPWKARDDYPLRFGGCILSHQIWGEERIGFIESQNCGEGEANANAQLIAAAPNLLQACKLAEGLIVKEIETMKRSFLPDPNDSEAAEIEVAEIRLQLIRAAISKAEGCQWATSLPNGRQTT